MDNVGVVFTWSVRISKYGNYTNIVTKSGKKEKKNRLLATVVDNVGALFMWSVHIS